MCVYFVAAKLQLESVWGSSASPEAATGGQVGAAGMKVQHPLPSAPPQGCNPLPEPESHWSPIRSLVLHRSLLLICLLKVYD